MSERALSRCVECGTVLKRGRKRFCSTTCREIDRERGRIVSVIDREIRKLKRLDRHFSTQALAGWRLFWHTRPRGSWELNGTVEVVASHRRVRGRQAWRYWIR